MAAPNGRRAGARTEESRAIGQRIREERTRAGLYRADVAALLKLTPKQVSRYEAGWPMSDVRLAQIARALGIAFDYLKSGTGEKLVVSKIAESEAPKGVPIIAVNIPELERLLNRLIAVNAPDLERLLDRLIERVAQAVLLALKPAAPSPPPPEPPGGKTRGRSRG